MKLQKKISRYFITVSLIIFILSSIASYFVLKNFVLDEVNETLIAEKNDLLLQLKKEKKLQNVLNNHTARLEIRIIENGEKVNEQFKDTLINIGEKGEGIPFRQLKLSEMINGENYLIILRRSLIEREDLITGISVMIVSIFFLIIVGLNLINYYGEKKWWKPFYKTLDQLSDFRLEQKKKLNLQSSQIDEFNILNKTLNNMAEKLHEDYQNLKEFSENASHEMQTPLAIIRSKLDVMIQEKSLSEEQFNLISSIYQAVNRLTKLNQSMNLLTKIENREFSQKENVGISELIKSQIDNLEFLISDKELNVEKNIEENISLNINSFILETLISNLLINAVKHNIQGGDFKIELNKNHLKISNTGKPLHTSPEKLFERFKKDSQTSDSPGLGLSIVKKICEQEGYGIEYKLCNNIHIVIVTLS